MFMTFSTRTITSVLTLSGLCVLLSGCGIHTGLQKIGDAIDRTRSEPSACEAADTPPHITTEPVRNLLGCESVLKTVYFTHPRTIKHGAASHEQQRTKACLARFFRPFTVRLRETVTTDRGTQRLSKTIPIQPPPPMVSDSGDQAMAFEGLSLTSSFLSSIYLKYDLQMTRSADQTQLKFLFANVQYANSSQTVGFRPILWDQHGVIDELGDVAKKLSNCMNEANHQGL